MEAFDQALRASLAAGCNGIASLASEPALVKASLGLRVGDAKTIPGDGWVQAQAACESGLCWPSSFDRELPDMSGRSRAQLLSNRRPLACERHELGPICFPWNVFCLQGCNMGAKIVEVLEELADGVVTDSILSDARSLVKLLGTTSAFYPATPL